MKRELRIVISVALATVLALLSLQFTSGALAVDSAENVSTSSAEPNQVGSVSIGEAEVNVSAPEKPSEEGLAEERPAAEKPTAEEEPTAQEPAVAEELAAKKSKAEEEPATEESELLTVALSDEESLSAQATVSYVERSWNGTEVISATKPIADVNPTSVPADGTMTSGWYILDKNVTVNDRIAITGEVNLILGDGFTLDVKGLSVPEGSKLTIYGQSEGTGKIYSHPSSGAGIGGYSGNNNGDIVISGGTIEATGADHCAGIGSNDGHTGGSITIYGGTVIAKGGSDGAAIGGGRNCSGGTITIYGGDITANGSTDSDTCENGAGIGGGDHGAGGTITINGGTITTYSRDGAGIGGGDDGDGGTITINGGTVTSTKVNQGQGARIGGGCDGAPGRVEINGGTITTVGGKGAGIGGGKGNKAGGDTSGVFINGGVIEASGSYGIGNGEGGKDVSVNLSYTDSTRDNISVTASSFHGTVTLWQRFRNDNGNYEADGISNLTTLAGSALVPWDGTNGGIDYVDPSKGPQTYTGVYSTYDGGFSALELSDGWYVISGETTSKNEIAVSGNVNLILRDGSVLRAPNIKVPAGSKLTIWGQSGGTGAIVVKADDASKAGIGGSNCDCGTITINGGTIDATGGDNKNGYGSAGIGGSYDHKPGTVIINGGTVTATGGKPAAGIGGGAWVHNRNISAGKVEINGGTVTATGKNGGAGIGSGLVYEHLEFDISPFDSETGVNATGTITIKGGTVNAYGSEHKATRSGSSATVMNRGTAAAIGGGALSTAGVITISGGEVNAYAVKDGAAIGTGGFHGASYWTKQGGTVSISGGTVNAVGYEGGGDGAAIGGGFGCTPSRIEISGGTVIATGGNCGIGRGKDANPQCTITLSWTDSTKDSMSVMADKYYGRVVIKNDLKDRDDGTLFPPVNPVKDLATIAGRTLIPAGTQTLFTITMGESVPEGVLTTNYQSALPDTKITITVHEKEGFKYNAILVYDEDLNLVEKLEARYVKFWDNTGFFFMPYSNVTIEMDIYGSDYLVTFDSDGGSAVDDKVVNPGGTVDKPDDPVKEGYVFAGWYLMEGETMASEPFDFSTPIYEDITLKARWTKVSEKAPEKASSPSSPSGKTLPATGDNTPLGVLAALSVAACSALLLGTKMRHSR